MMNVKPLYRILVKMIPSVEDIHNPLGLKLMDRKKHWEHTARRGIVVQLPALAECDVRVGDVVCFQGSAGFTLDGDIMDEGLDEDQLKGESFRWLKNHEIMAVDEVETERRAQKELAVA